MDIYNNTEYMLSRLTEKHKKKICNYYMYASSTLAPDRLLNCALSAFMFITTFDPNHQIINHTSQRLNQIHLSKIRFELRPMYAIIQPQQHAALRSHLKKDPLTAEHRRFWRCTECYVSPCFSSTRFFSY